MKSPFPGMDPYLERNWRSVRQNLITSAQWTINERLPADLRARVEERVFVEADGTGREHYPDVHVVEFPRRGPTTSAGSVSIANTAEDEGSAAVADSVMVEVGDEPATQGYVVIREAGTGNRIVTVIEFISPSNKLPGEGRALYLAKQRECAAAHVSLVEIDLVRRGDWVMSVPRHRIPASHRTTYQVCVRRGWRPGVTQVYGASLRRRLPVIGVPLRETDEEVKLDLQGLVDQCYQRGRHDDLDYAAPLVPALDPDDAAWAGELLRSAGKR